MSASRVFNNRTKAFRALSSKVMGRVLFKSYSQGFGLGIGYTYARFQRWGMDEICRQPQIMYYRRFFVIGPNCFNISFEIFEGPGALLFGSRSMILYHSSAEGKDIKLL